MIEISDYYRKKTEAYRLIDDMFTKGKTEEEIIFKIQTIYGFSEKFVFSRIELLKKLGVNNGVS